MARDTVVTLPWPPRTLSPNARKHWRAVHKAKAAYKELCDGVLMAAGKAPTIGEGRIALTITLSPPDARKRDRDNMQGSLKYALDRFAAWLGVDDYRFDPTYHFADPVKGGAVSITIGGPQA